MPRKRQTQAPQTAAAQAYGVAGEQMEAQAAMPLPTAPVSSETAQNPPPAAPGPALFGSDGAPSPGVLEAAAAGPSPGLPLSAPSELPGQPVTAGLPIGPGPGPEVLKTHQRQSPVADKLVRIARSTGNADLLAIADRLRANGVK